MTIDEAIKICEEDVEKIGGNPQSDRHAERCRQIAEWLKELKELREENKVLMQECDRLIKEKGELLKQHEQKAEYKRLLKAAVEDFAKLDRVNTKVRNCMMPDMDCADCPLSWDSVDDSVEPCHNWRYTNEALKLIES